MLKKFSLAFIVFIATFIGAIVVGAAETTMKDVWLAVTAPKTNEVATMIYEVRLPREVAAVVVGAALAVAGAIMQGMTRNPLADPGLIGLTAGANAALAVMFAFFPSATYMQTVFACFVGAAFGSLLVFGIGAKQFSPFRIVLAGAAISTFLYAVAEGIGLIYKVSKDVSMWTAGGMMGTTWHELKIVTPFICFALLFAFWQSRQLTILSMSEEVAVGLGQQLTRVKTILFFIVIVLAGASVALVGNLAFVGLMIPHLVRSLVGTDYRFILPMSAIGGATFMLFADTIARMIHAPYETPVVAVVAVMGLPFFLFIVRKGEKML
ncbi:iron complex transport system permease protein [Anoxybacillus tengchongensis]|uniref:Iron complex transport system permease protein n=2 Tax=Anoxybacillus tengchongensis TaxID=576944 RepID=A0A7W9YP39_9BACL|nr:iron complex transport system permease protein [Anoxybacillus tengchongensis]